MFYYLVSGRSPVIQTFAEVDQRSSSATPPCSLQLTAPISAYFIGKSHCTPPIPEPLTKLFRSWLLSSFSFVVRPQLLSAHPRGNATIGISGPAQSQTGRDASSRASGGSIAPCFIYYCFVGSKRIVVAYRTLRVSVIWGIIPDIITVQQGFLYGCPCTFNRLFFLETCTKQIGCYLPVNSFFAF